MEPEYIKKLHAQTFERIEKHGLKVGTILKNKKTNVCEVIMSIHPFYGFIITKAISNTPTLKQNAENIEGFEIVR